MLRATASMWLASFEFDAKAIGKCHEELMLFLAVRVDGNTGSGVHLYCLRRRRYGIGQIISRGRSIHFVGQDCRAVPLKPACFRPPRIRCCSF